MIEKYKIVMGKNNIDINYQYKCSENCKMLELVLSRGPNQDPLRLNPRVFVARLITCIYNLLGHV